MILVWRILPFTWDEPEELFEIVWYRGFCGFRNSKGNMITSFYYDDAKLFHEGRAAVKKQGNWGYIDKRGNEIIPLIYLNVTDFSEGLAGVEGWAEKTEVDEVSEGFDWEGRWNWGVIDNIGNQITPCKFGKVEMFKEGFAVVRSVWGNDYGYIDHSGNEAISIKYAEAHSFINGIAIVRSDCYSHNNYTQIDYTGKEICTVYKPDIKRDDQLQIDDGVKTIDVDGKYGLVDREGKEIAPVKYDRMGPFHCGLSVVELNNKFGFVDKKGKETFVPYFLLNSFCEGIAKVSLWRDSGPFSYINTEGELITQKFFKTATDFNNGTANVSFEIRTDFEQPHFNRSQISGTINKFGVWDYSSRYLHPDLRNCTFLFCYDFVRSFSEGLIAVSLNCRWGFVDEKGNKVIPLKFLMAFSFSDQRAIVQDVKTEKYGIINSLGNITIPLIYDRIKLRLIFDQLVCVSLNEKWGFVDLIGNEVIPFEYDEVGYYSDGLVIVLIYEPEKYGIRVGKLGAIDQFGNEIIPVEYDRLGYSLGHSFEVDTDRDQENWRCDFYEGITRFKKDSEWGIIDINGCEIHTLTTEREDNKMYYDEDSEEWFPGSDVINRWIRVQFNYIGKCKDGLIKVKTINNYYGFINKAGEEVVKFKYHFAEEFSNGLAMVNVGGEWKDEMDSYSIDPVTGDAESDYKRVFKGGLWGCVNMMGEEQIPIKFKTIEENDSGFYLVSSSEYYGLIDLYGNPLNIEKA